MAPPDARSDPGLAELMQRLGYNFRRPEWLEQALTHSSLSVVRHKRNQSNERLEFLGDRVLGLVVAEMLFARFPDEAEGDLAYRHAGLARRDALAQVARTIDLGAFLRLSRGEEEGGGRDNPGLLADCCEAVIAALYLDGGLDAASAFIRAHWAALVEERRAPPKDDKTRLQEWAQGGGRPLPVYREIGREGPGHAPVFTIEVVVAGCEPGRGEGPSKRAAEQAAARVLLERLGVDRDGA
jgi:ribonuclease-3